MVRFKNVSSARKMHEDFSTALLANVPTPVEPIETLSVPGTALWVKRDDLIHPLYGGNKVRRLVGLLRAARQKNARKLLTIGSVGSHHILATTLFGRRFGFDVEAVLVPQPHNAHAYRTACASISQGVAAHPAGSFAAGAWRLASLIGRECYVIPPGGSNVVGAAGYADAARELGQQIRQGALPEPDVIFVGLGSGGTFAGLAAGLAQEGICSSLIGIIIAEPVWAVRRLTQLLAKRLEVRMNGGPARSRPNLVMDDTYLGKGYGYTTKSSENAVRVALSAGLVLETTYTGKTFAAVMDAIASRRYKNILYWHTLSGASLDPLLPNECATLPPNIADLFVAQVYP